MSGTGAAPILAEAHDASTVGLEHLRLRAETMGVRVDQNLERMRQVLLTGSLTLAQRALRADEDIDAMAASLTERCCDALVRPAPEVGGPHLVVSVLRVIGELERVGDLAVYVVGLAPDHHLLCSDERTFDIVCVMADEVVDRFRAALRAWDTGDLSLATELARGARSMDLFEEQLIEALRRLSRPDAALLAMRALAVGRSLGRIAEHANLVATQVRYLVTGSTRHLATEAR
jgi:phosphate transport system protein